jgi:hypothetical protein
LFSKLFKSPVTVRNSSCTCDGYFHRYEDSDLWSVYE